MQDSINIQRIATKHRALAGLMDERISRQWAAAEARAYGWGGVRAVSRAIGMSPNTIVKGLAELAARREDPEAPVGTRLRVAGGGRLRATDADPGLAESLERLVDPATRGDPMSPLRWTCKSTAQLAEALKLQGHTVSHQTVALLLNELGYSLQANRKTREGSSHPDRNAQ